MTKLTLFSKDKVVVKKNQTSVQKASASDITQSIEEFVYALEKTQRIYNAAVTELVELRNQLKREPNNPDVQADFATLRSSIQASKEVIKNKIEELQEFCNQQPDAIAKVSIPPIVEKSLKR
ncbi:MAG: hypothetical protein EPO11_09730 [Gammaproteobacteria bacterium]|nr:MAG: hypothetical protein EPO11_09730 [Gammaproteobacteria bacterium]